MHAACRWRSHPQQQERKSLRVGICYESFQLTFAFGKIALNALELKLSDAVTLAVPQSLQSITAYVLLEQEHWFEKEMDFLRHWLRPGMTVIDVGANLGVYSVPMAHLVGQTGHVFAYEPGSETRALLERSRELNAAVNLDISPLALSNREREGWLVFGASSELNALGDSGAGEPVRITSLDSEDAARGWPSPDFLKIDAEGEEERILAGGRNFFARYSPLIKFEVKADKVNEHLRALFPTIGYRLFRQLGGAPVLIADHPLQPLDKYELNMFAAKPDRVCALSQQGFLVDAVPAWVPSADTCKVAELFWRSQKFAAVINLPDGNGMHTDSLRLSQQPRSLCHMAHRGSANCNARRGSRICIARSTDRVCARTYGRTSIVVCPRRMGMGRAWRERCRLAAPPPKSARPPNSTQRAVLASASALRQLIAGQSTNWFVGAAAEQFEQTFSFSSIFGGASAVLPWLCTQPFASTEMERRLILVAARAGQRPAVPERLCQVKLDHLNADIWRAGKVPGTIAGPYQPATL